MLSYETSCTLQSDAESTTNGNHMPVSGLHTVTVQITGTFTATVTFQGTQDNVNWKILRGYNLTAGSVSSTAAAAGIFVVPVIGLQAFRARVSAYTSGKVTVTARALSPSIALPWADVATLAGAPPQMDDTDKLAVSAYGKASTAGDTPLLLTSAGRLVAALGGSEAEGDALQVRSFTLAINASDASGRLAVVPLVYNGATWDRQRGNQEITLFASAARTASANSPDQTNYNHRGAILYLDVTAIADTPSIQIQLQMKDPVSSDYHTIFTIGANVTATGNYTYLIYPGALAGAAGNITEAVNMVIPRTWRVRIAHGDSDSITYSLSASMIL